MVDLHGGVVAVSVFANTNYPETVLDLMPHRLQQKAVDGYDSF